MPYDKNAIDEIAGIHEDRIDQITARLKEFRELWESGSEEQIFAELVFCLLTPQSKARLCWGKVEHLMDGELIARADTEEMAAEIDPVRFKHTKAKRVVEARERFGPESRTSIRAPPHGFRQSGVFGPTRLSHCRAGPRPCR